MAIKSINQETLVPVGLAVLIIGTTAMWVSDTRNGMKTASEQIEILNRNNEANIKLIYEINARLSRIEWKLSGDENSFTRKK